MLIKMVLKNTEIHLFRHGETDWNVEGRFQSLEISKLTKKGILQAQKLGHKIKDIKFDNIYCSPSLRTKQTAFHIWPKQKNRIQYSDDLLEINLGSMEGKLYSDVKENDFSSYDHFFNKPHLFSLKGAESFNELTKRSHKIISKFSKMNIGGKIAIVSHGAFIKAFMTFIDNKKIKEIWDPPFMDNCSHNIILFDQDNSFLITKYAGIDK